MSKSAATKSKQRWNSEHYTQVKVSIDPEVASAFKEACASSGVSMASKLSQYMSEYSNIAKKTGRSPEYATKRQRRAAYKLIAQQLKRLKAAEEHSRDCIPESFHGTEIYENADQCVSSLEDILELMESILVP